MSTERVVTKSIDASRIVPSASAGAFRNVQRSATPSSAAIERPAGDQAIAGAGVEDSLSALQIGAVEDKVAHAPQKAQAFLRGLCVATETLLEYPL